MQLDRKEPLCGSNAMWLFVDRFRRYVAKKKRRGFRGCVRTGRETAGPSTSLRSGRDDNSVAREMPKNTRGMDLNSPTKCVIPTGA
jgi:hypothetical protein